MTQTEEQTLAEQEALLAECKLYKGEKEPDTKDAPVESDEAEVVTGLPVTGPATTIIGAPVHRAPWSTGIFACFGNGDEHFSSDLEVCECLPSSNFIEHVCYQFLTNIIQCHQGTWLRAFPVSN